jgi:ABC-2 type transport system permease protein
VLVFGTIFTASESPTFDLSVQDNSGTEASERLLEGLADYHAFSVKLVPVDADPVQYARKHKLNLLLVIPKDFDELQKQRFDQEDTRVSASFTYIYDPSSTSVDTKLHLLKMMVASANQKASGTSPFLKLKPVSILSERYRFIDFFVPGIIAMAIMTSCLTGALNMNAELRQKGILRKLATTPITPPDWLLSNILYQLVLAVISTTAILLVSYFVFDVRLAINGWLSAYIVLATFAFVGIGMMLTPIAKESESATAIGNAILFPMMFLSGTFFPVEMMPRFLQSFAQVLPLYYINEGLRASMIFVDHMEALRCAAITGGFAVAVFVAGVLMTRWGREG